MREEWKEGGEIYSFCFTYGSLSFRITKQPFLLPHPSPCLESFHSRPESLPETSDPHSALTSLGESWTEGAVASRPSAWCWIASYEGMGSLIVWVLWE